MKKILCSLFFCSIAAFGNVSDSTSNSKNDFCNIKIIDSSSTLNSSKLAEYRYDMPNASRYFINPTAFTEPKGSLTYQNTDFLYHSLTYGVNNHLTLSGGFLWKQNLFIYFIGQKVSFGKNRLKLSFGNIIGNGNKKNDWLILNQNYKFINADKFIGVLNSTLTLGTADKNISLGVVFPYQIDTGFLANRYIFLSGIYRINDSSLALIVETLHIWNTNYSDVTVGGKVFGKKISVCLGLSNKSEIANRNQPSKLFFSLNMSYRLK